MTANHSRRDAGSTDDQASTLIPLHLKLKLKPLFTEEIDKLSARLSSRITEFDSEVTCTFCDTVMRLEEIDFEWPYGSYYVMFPGIPAYRCQTCDRTFFPEEVRELMAAEVERTIQAQDVEPLPRNPRALAFAQRHASHS